MENDYIDVLLEHLNDRRLSFAGQEYFLCQQREQRALDALSATLNEQQRALLLDYEAEKNAAASVAEDILARQAFLLAREMFR